MNMFWRVYGTLAIILIFSVVMVMGCQDGGNTRKDPDIRTSKKDRGPNTKEGISSKGKSSTRGPNTKEPTGSRGYDAGPNTRDAGPGPNTAGPGPNTRDVGPGPNTAGPGPNTAVAKAAPAGGKALFEKRCSKCHDLDRVLALRESPRTWRTIVATMRLKPFNSISNDEAEVIVDYLSSIRGR